MGLGVDQTAGGAQDRRVNRVRTAKTGGNNGPILDPSNAVLNPYPNLAQLSVEGVLFQGQLLSLWFLNRSLDLQARHLLFCPSLWVGYRHLADLLG